MCTRKNISSKYQQVLVHHSSARILCAVLCMVLLIHVQGGCSQTEGGAAWRWENRKMSSERRLIAWLKQGQCLIPEYIKTQPLDSAIISECPSSPSSHSGSLTTLLVCLLQVLFSNCLQRMHVEGSGSRYSDVHQQMLEMGLNCKPKSNVWECLK